MGEQQPQGHERQGEQDEQEILELAGRLFEAARGGDADTLGAYVDAGLPVNLANDRGDTLLMLAAYHGHTAAVRALLDRGADPDRANDRGQTPLAGAVFKNERDVVTALVRAGADPDAGTPSAREAARMFGKDDMLSSTDG
jgi:ankyrin repeat protein